MRMAQHALWTGASTCSCGKMLVKPVPFFPAQAFVTTWHPEVAKDTASKPNLHYFYICCRVVVWIRMNNINNNNNIQTCRVVIV